MSRVAVVVGIVVCVVLVTLPRFDQADIGPISALTGTEQGGNRGDAALYEWYVETLRGDRDSLPPAPFRYRPVVPVMAAPLPLSASVALNIVNVTALAVASMAVWGVLGVLGLAERRRIAGCLLFIVSFPTFYYGSIGYVDPVAVAVLAAGTWALFTDRRILATALIVLGAATRESTVVLPVVGVVWLWVSSHPRRERIIWSLTWAGGFLAAVAAIRFSLHGAGTNVWRPSLDLAVENLSRPRTWLSAVLTLGLPAVIVAGRSSRLRRPDRAHVTVLVAGAAVGVAVFVYAVTAAYADGRFLWPVTVFTVPLAMLAVSTAAESR